MSDNEEAVGYNIDVQDDGKMVFEIEDAQAYQAFVAGTNDHKQWTRHPVTNELQNVLTTNRKHSQIFVKYNDTYNRVK